MSSQEGRSGSERRTAFARGPAGGSGPLGRAARVFAAVLLLACTGATLVTAIGGRGPIVGALTMLFLLFGPGSVLAWLLSGLGLPVRLLIALFGGPVLDTLVAQGMLATRTWAIDRGVIIVLLATDLAFAVGMALRPLPVQPTRRAAAPETLADGVPQPRT